MTCRPLATAASRKALAGCFSKENLEEWVNRKWGEVSPKEGAERSGHYVDLVSHQISVECASMLENHPHPSSALCRAFYQSSAFTPERLLLTAVGRSPNTELPLVFQAGDSYLLWKTADVSPQEVILTWELGGSHGCTMLAVDPSARRVYFGSAIRNSEVLEGFLFRRLLTPLHLFYSNLLLKSMVKQLEQTVDKSGDK